NGARHHQRVQGHFEREVDRSRRSGRRYFGSPRHDRSGPAGSYPGGVDVQLLHLQGGSVRRGDGKLQLRVDRLLPEAVAKRRRREALAPWKPRPQRLNRRKAAVSVQDLWRVEQQGRRSEASPLLPSSVETDDGKTKRKGYQAQGSASRRRHQR